MSDSPQVQTDAPILPDFQDGVSYAIQLAHPVEFPSGSGNFLRPDQSVTVDGSLARTLKDSILDAIATG